MQRNHKGLKILLIEPFYSGSHKAWADGLISHSRHKIDLATLPGRHWKWRMHGAAVTFAESLKTTVQQYDLIVVTDMLDLATFKGLLHIEVPVIAYFHENQLAYPWSDTDPDVDLQRDRRYMWINMTTAMASDQVWFNSNYNRDSFLNGLKKFLSAFPDHQNFDLESLDSKSSVVPLGLDLQDLLVSSGKRSDQLTTFLWNHRWEYDKNPTLFFETMITLQKEGLDFKLCILGEHTNKYPDIFNAARDKLRDKIIQFGPVASRIAYIEGLAKCDVLPVTNKQDFFGISVVEALAAGVMPILPKGLAYNEYLDEGLYQNYYYNNTKELLHMCKQAIQDLQFEDLRKTVENYDWLHMIGVYDSMFEKEAG